MRNEDIPPRPRRRSHEPIRPRPRLPLCPTPVRSPLRRGDRTQARRWPLAARLDPTDEEPLADHGLLAAPQTSLAYLKIALEKNPASQAAWRGMHWAVQRLRKEFGDRARVPIAHASVPPARARAAGAYPAGLPTVVPEGALPLPPAPSALPRPAWRSHPAHPHPPARTLRVSRSVAAWAVVVFLVVFGGLLLSAVAGTYIVSGLQRVGGAAISILFKPSLTPRIPALDPDGHLHADLTASSTPTPHPRRPLPRPPRRCPLETPIPTHRYARPAADCPAPTGAGSAQRFDPVGIGPHK